MQKKMIYIHKKSGCWYNLIAMGTDKTNSDQVVAIYHPNNDKNSIYVTSLIDFNIKFRKATVDDI